MTVMKRCPKCGETKPLSEFYALRAGWVGPYCKPCTKADVQRWQRENPEKHYRKQRRSDLKRRYGLSESDYDKMLAAQDGRCPICGVILGEVQVAVDHNHETGQVRGVLCHRCNRTLGLFGDDPGRLRRAAAYLRKADKSG